MEAVWNPGGPATGYRSPSPGRKRDSVRKADLEAVFARDRFTCRYAQCGRKTIALPALKLLSRVFPDLLPYHPNWKPLEDHALYWTSSTSMEHEISFPSGGTSAIENLLTTCYQCNDVKKHLPLELLGWTVAPVSAIAWDGLMSTVPRLKVVLDRSSTEGGAA